jgi:hypothetical protein
MGMDKARVILLEEGAVKEGAAMSQTNAILDPMQTGSEAKSLERDLSALVVGQDEAIEQIITVYQMYLTGLSPVGRPKGNSFPRTPDREKHEWSRRPRRISGASGSIGHARLHPVHSIPGKAGGRGSFAFIK